MCETNLEVIGRIRCGKNDMAISDSEGVVGIGLGEDPESPLAGEVRGRKLVSLMVKEGG